MWGASVRGLTGRERLVGLAAAAVLAIATPVIFQSGRAAHETAVAPPSPSPTPTKTAAPSPKPRPRPVRTAPPVDRPLPPAPPRTGCPGIPVQGGPPQPLPAPKVADSALPNPLPVKAKAASLQAVAGKGLWATPMGDGPVNVASVVARAKATQVRSLWIRTGGSRQGYYGDRFLPQLVPAAHAAGLRVIAWDFPDLSDPVADAARADKALAAGVDGFSADVETTAEGTHITVRRLTLYLSLVRSYAGDRPLVATVPRPSEYRKTFPYAAFAPYADVYAPMVYWSCHEPGALVQQAIRALGRWLPVAPIGQAYNMGPEGGRRGTPSAAETLRFLDAARHAGAIGASLWTVEQAGRAQLRALATYRWAS